MALFLEGREIKDLYPESGAARPDEGRLTFHLQRTPASDEAWADLLGAPPIGSQFFKRPMEVSVGLAGGFAEPTDLKGAKRLDFVRIRQMRFWVSWFALALFLFGMWKLSRRSDMLRDGGPQPKHPTTGQPLRKAYSLGRCQMAWWFVWVVVSFVFIWQITGATDIVTASALALIGIGAGTSLGAAAIDQGKSEETRTKLTNLETEKVELTTAIAELDSQLRAVPTPTNQQQLTTDRTAKAARLATVNKEIATLSASAGPPPSENFLTDILTDAHGVSFHRFQMVVWTLVLSGVFLLSVYRRLSMPEFSATLLALLGISAGTYLGFKIPEKAA